MATLLTKKLEELTRQDETLEPLLAQWSFDRRLTAKALQNVGKIFPHYSRHDESHSVQILINIERVLGESRIEKLSATDIWLILEAAYLHDIGMVVSQKEQLKDWQDGEILKFAKKQSVYVSGEASEFLKKIIAANGRIDLFESDNHPLVQAGMLGFFLSDFYRKKHADRAEKITLSPEETIGLNSPRTELIPKRLFRLLGEICSVHGKGYSDLMKLPHIASGLGKEKIHPRFVACMLRLGDLLDLDDNRFCPVMLAVAGEVPSSTHAHIDKHHAVRHLRVDPERIEVHAVCTTYDGFVESENWFDYLRQEIAWQMAHWADIVPSESFGLLPTIGEIRTELSGYELVENQSRPRFELDQPKVMELLQGAGLYDHPRDAFREIIQNAVDSTLIYIWLRHGENEANELPIDEVIGNLDNPYDEKVLKILGKYPIQIKIENKFDNNEDLEIGFTEITIQDRGIGISREDLASMMKVGGSYLNVWKKEVLERMPVWMRPSGAFGIGLQSAFLLSNEIRFRSKSVRSGEELIIRMSDPTGKERGAIYVERVQNSALAKAPGATLQLRMRDEVVRRFSLGRNPYEFHDPMVSREPNFFSGIFENIPLPILLNGRQISNSEIGGDWQYHPGVGVAVAIDSKSFGAPAYFYKSQRVRRRVNDKSLPCRVYVNIFSPAETTVTINRSMLRSGPIEEKIDGAIVESLKSAFEKSSAPNERALLSATALSFGISLSADYLNCRWQEVDKYGHRQYVWVEKGTKPTFPTIKEILDSGLEVMQMFGDYSPRYLLWKGRYYSCSRDSIALFFKAAEDQKLKGYIKGVEEKFAIIGFDLGREAWDSPKLLELIRMSLIENLRLAFPVDSKFKALASMKWTMRLGENSRAPFCPGRDYMYSPFVVRNGKVRIERLEELVLWTFENRLNKNVNLEMIKSSFLDFIQFIDEIMSEDSMWLTMRERNEPRN